MNADEKELVDETIESIIGDDHARLADVMFELAKRTDEHYRVLYKHRLKHGFVLRYVERLLWESEASDQARASVVSSVQVEEVAKHVAPRPCSDDFDYMDTSPSGKASSNPRPCSEDFDYVDSPCAKGTVARPLPCSDDFEYMGAADDVADIMVPASLPAKVVEATATFVELRDRGMSAGVAELADMGGKEAAELATDMVELRPKRPSVIAIVEEMVVEEPASKAVPAQMELETPVREAKSDSCPASASAASPGQTGSTAMELKDLSTAPPVEMVELAEDDATPSLFNPQSRLKPTNTLFPAAKAAPNSFSSGPASVAQSRLQKLSQESSDSNSSDEEGDFTLHSSPGVQAVKQYRPATTEAKMAGKAATSSSIGMPSLHSGLEGEYEKDSGASAGWSHTGKFTKESTKVPSLFPK